MSWISPVAEPWLCIKSSDSPNQGCGFRTFLFLLNVGFLKRYNTSGQNYIIKCGINTFISKRS